MAQMFTAFINLKYKTIYKMNAAYVFGDPNVIFCTWEWLRGVQSGRPPDHQRNP